MSKKNILIINPISLFPKVMASQDRVVTMAKTLAADHNVDIVTLVKTDWDAKLSAKEIKSICCAYYPIYAKNTSFLRRKYFGLIYILTHIFLGYSARYYYWGGKATNKKICEIIDKNNYDVVQIEFWYQGNIFDHVGKNVCKVLDTVDVMYEKKYLGYFHRYGNKIPFFKKRELVKYKTTEKNMISKTDVVIAISSQDRTKLEKIAPSKLHITIPMGQDISFYKKCISDPEPKTILFYGSLSGDQNVIAFERLYYKIFPLIKSKISDVKLLIVGAKPPQKISKLHDGKNVEVTGFVEDIRKPLSRGWLAIIPLEIAAGFRGRVIELMAMGIPVIGTHNALDCMEMGNGIHGYISDNDEEMGEMAVFLLKNKNKRNEISRKCQEFVTDKYSLDATYGKLAKLYSNL